MIRVGRVSLLGLWNHWARGETRPSHKDVIRHELGHVVLDKNLKLARQLGYGRLFGTPDSYHPKSHVSDYAASNADEDFAETAMFFLKHKGRMPRRFSRIRLRRKWNFIRRLGRHLRRKS
ncbi:MAG: hypothetical protein IH623_12730 [Verrucomicrobia bacterium]|nr:hypothetical protein [Verrucomicrobiota bacterium]